MTGIDPLASSGDQDVGPQPEELAGASPVPEETPPPPPVPSPPPPPPPPLPPEPVAVPINWLVDQGSGPIRYRALMELAKISPVPERLLSLVYGHPPAITLAITQRSEGTWYNAMLSVPSPRAAAFEGIGTIMAYRRLLEYGWDREAPPLLHARRVLFRLLAEDNDPSLLFELAEKGKADDDVVRRNRVLLREAAAAALAQAGYEGDPRLRGAALRLLARVMAHIRSPLAADPWADPGKKVLAPGAAPPSYFFLLMLAHMPLFRLEHASEMDDLLRYLTSGQHAGTGSQRHLVMGDPLTDEEGANDIAFATAWLELAARLGYLKRYDPWAQSFARLIEQCDESFVWRGKRAMGGSRASTPFVWPGFQLGSGSAEDQASEVTFRLALIAKFAGRPLELI